ncbi:MAG: DJ-1/PfpI family protein [Oscillospiraceae bacterium]|jgi:4-methyl-5(b-hydroxyethyl)-thiazole monophosphate biosynthesis|nr:DJ-1/PfpI family protein [Oscillospiraceae bacterium]
MVYILLADGFETIEALAPADILRRAEIPAALAAVSGEAAVSSHGIAVKADMSLDGVRPADLAEGDMIMLPGGGEGVKNLAGTPAVAELIRAANGCGAFLAAICAAPSILADMGLLKGRSAVSHPSVKDALIKGGAVYVEDARVVTDGRIITAKAAGNSIDFGLTLAEVLKTAQTAQNIKSDIFY